MTNIRELSIVIVANNHNPTILNPDFLKYNKIVPEDWKLAAPPICTEPVAQVKYESNVSIVAQFDKLVFTQTSLAQSIDETFLPEIVVKYVNTLPHVSYNAVGINPKGHASPDKIEDPKSYIAERLLAPGPWREMGDSGVKVTVKYAFSISGVECQLSVDDGLYQQKDQDPLSVMLLAANFHHNLKGKNSSEKLEDLINIVTNWKSDIETYVKLVEEIFGG